MEKKFGRGLVLGKFMPPHNGHLFLIKTAAEQCEKVFVMVCSLKNEPIKGILRYNWLRMIFQDQNNIEIIHVQDENPQYPKECESLDVFYTQFWVPTVFNRVSRVDVIFTSEEYGDEFAKYLGVQHVLVDLHRKTHAISGTAVRNNPYNNWDLIPIDVKQYYCKRVVIVGPESTGKTTITNNLAKYFGCDKVAEYGRTYTEKVKIAKEFTIEDFEHIAVEHDNDIIDTHIDTEGKFLFIDTEILTTKIFGEMYLGHEFSSGLIDEILQHQWFDLYLLMDVDVPWVDDGTRDFPHERQNHFNRLKSELEQLGENFIVINGNYEERFEKAKKVCEELIS